MPVPNFAAQGPARSAWRTPSPAPPLTSLALPRPTALLAPPWPLADNIRKPRSAPPLPVPTATMTTTSALASDPCPSSPPSRAPAHLPLGCHHAHTQRRPITPPRGASIPVARPPLCPCPGESLPLSPRCRSAVTPLPRPPALLAPPCPWPAGTWARGRTARWRRRRRRRRRQAAGGSPGRRLRGG